MSSSAYEILPDGKCKERQAADCGEADREKTFCCLHCNVRVYLHLPEAGRGISPYFSADSEPHKKECPNYREDLFRTVAHLDHTGSGVDLSELMKGFRQVDRRPRPEGGKGKSGGLISGIEKGPAEETDRPIRREARTPKTIIQLYGILKDPSVTEYAGHDAKELIVDKSTINYHRNHTLDHPAMVVCKRCTPPQKIKGRLADEGIYPRSLTFSAPYVAPQKQKDIYYVLVCNTADDRSTILNTITKDREKCGKNGADDKYLAIAKWRLYIENNRFRVYIGNLPNSGCFRKLRPSNDLEDITVFEKEE